MKLLIPFLIFFGAMVVISIVSLILSKKNKKNVPVSRMWAYVYNWLFWIGIGGLFLLFARYEGIAQLSMRFILFLWLVCFVVWGGYVLWFRLKTYKKMVKEEKIKKEKEKYFRKK